MNENICVCCGDLVPEGTHICRYCQRNVVESGATLQNGNTTKKVYNSLRKENND